MKPIYCTECLDRIPFDFFIQGKAAFSRGRPYLVDQAKRLGLKLDVKPPVEFADALGFGAMSESIYEPDPCKPFAPSTTRIVNMDAKTGLTASKGGPRCELEIVCESDGYSESHPPVRMDLIPYSSMNNALVLGRDSTFTRLFKTHLRVSRKHCRIWMAEGKVFVQDLNASNKTFLDGYELEPERCYQFFMNQFLTLGAKHSAIRITLDASGFPNVENSSTPKDPDLSSTKFEEPLRTELYRPITRPPAAMQSDRS